MDHGTVVTPSVDASEFGAFNLVLVTYGVVLNLSRGLATDPLTVRYNGLPDQRWRYAVARSSSTATFVGLGAGAVCVLIGSAITGMVGSCFVALGLTPGPDAAGQPALRFLRCRPRAASLRQRRDLGRGPDPTMLLAGTVGTPFGFVLAWEGQTRLVPRAACVAGWLRTHRDLGVRYAVET